MSREGEDYECHYESLCEQIDRGEKNNCVDVRIRSGEFNVLMGSMCVCAPPSVCLMC